MIALVRGLRGRRQAFSQLLAQATDELQQQVAAVFREAVVSVQDTQRDVAERRLAVDLLAEAGDQTHVLADLALNETERAVRLQAIRALAGQPDLPGRPR